MTTQEFFTDLSTFGINLINQHTFSGETFISDGWYIAVGTGNLIPSKDTTSLVNKIFDKNSSGYPGITIGTDPNVGRYAELQLPETLCGNIITEAALFDADNNLILSANTSLDFTKSFSEGLYKTLKIRLSLNAIPADLKIVTINPPSSFPTTTQVTNIAQTTVNTHNADDTAHANFARKSDLLNYLELAKTINIPIGLSLSQNSKNITVAQGMVLDSTKTTFLTLTDFFTKDFSVAFTAGNGQGALVDTTLTANTTIYVFVIETASGTTDVCGALSEGFTLPVGYTKKALIGFIKTDAKGYIITVAPQLDLRKILLENDILKNYRNLLPDYTKLIHQAWGTTYAATQDGWLMTYDNLYTGTNAYVVVNGVTVANGVNGTDGVTPMFCQIPIAIGDVYYVTGNARGPLDIIFVPAKS